GLRSPFGTAAADRIVWTSGIRSRSEFPRLSRVRRLPRFGADRWTGTDQWIWAASARRGRTGCGGSARSSAARPPNRPPPRPTARAPPAGPPHAPPDGGRARGNVVPFRPAPPVGPKQAPSLPPVERRAFRELAQELTSRLRGSHAAVTAEAVAQELAASHAQALSHDELRRGFRQALKQKNDPAASPPPRQEPSEKTSPETRQQQHQ